MNDIIEADKATAEKLGALWDEYGHRHSLVWSNLYKLLAAVLALSIAPYANVNLAGKLNLLLAVPPILSLALLWVSKPRIKRELYILAKIRTRYRAWQRALMGVDVRADREPGAEADDAGSDFSSHVMCFYWMIAAAVLLNVVVSGLWILSLL